MEPCDQLQAGEVGYFTASIKNVKDTRVGDTSTGVEQSAAEALPLRREDRQALAAMGDALQGDEENICKAILLTNKSLRKDLELTRDRRQETEKRSAALWLSGAALLVILLI